MGPQVSHFVVFLEWRSFQKEPFLLLGILRKYMLGEAKENHVSWTRTEICQSDCHPFTVSTDCKQNQNFINIVCRNLAPRRTPFQTCSNKTSWCCQYQRALGYSYVTLTSADFIKQQPTNQTSLLYLKKTFNAPRFETKIHCSVQGDQNSSL